MSNILPRLTRSGAARPAAGIVHLGLGAFFRAFGVPAIEEAMAASGGNWGIIGVSLKTPGTRDKLAPQDFVYTAVEQAPGGERPQIHEAVQSVLVAPEDPEAVLNIMAEPKTRIVSLTVTEKGYCREPATGRLDTDRREIRHDLANPLPQSAPGFLVRALERRRRAGHPPFTVLSCDNLPENGALTRSIVLTMARAIDPDLAAWIEAQGRFPSTMVDRIVPATRPEDVERIAHLTGRLDAAPVLHEPFRQWVIEDDFVPVPGRDARPDFAAAGILMVDDVRPYELMKLRMLNGTHSALAYLGYLAGHETVYAASTDPVYETFLGMLWTAELAPSFDPPDGIDLEGYAAQLLARYKNSAIQHRTWQIAMDGSQKLPQRILAPLSDNLAAGRASPGLILVIAAWIRYVSGTDDAGADIDVRDAALDRLQAAVAASTDGTERVNALLSLSDVFDPALATEIEADVVAAYETLSANGARAAIAKILPNA
ncbi:MAG: mannitol dehydrogenase family protein [Roseibium sp.]|nr:mannitol dehydrogenase family protein [Roseibium sp.]